MSVIVITGTSRGIGLEMVKILAEQGHKIYALSRNSKPTQDLNHKNVFEILLLALQLNNFRVTYLFSMNPTSSEKEQDAPIKTLEPPPPSLK